MIELRRHVESPLQLTLVYFMKWGQDRFRRKPVNLQKTAITNFYREHKGSSPVTPILHLSH